MSKFARYSSPARAPALPAALATPVASALLWFCWSVRDTRATVTAAVIARRRTHNDANKQRRRAPANTSPLHAHSGT